MEPIIHFVVPFIALTLTGLNVRKAFLISLFALLPDVDALFLIHRSLTHSIVVLLAVAAPLILLACKLKPNLRNYGVLALLSIASHIVLDTFTDFTPILWPLYGYSVWVKADLTAHIGSFPTLALNLYLLTEPIKFQHSQSLDAPLFTGGGLIISTVMLLPFFVKALQRRLRVVR